MRLDTRHIVRISFALTLSVFGTGCASLFAPDCARFEQERKQTDYTTSFEYSSSKTRKLTAELKPLAAKSLAAAPLYKAVPGDSAVRHCTHLTIRKELYLQRSDKARSLIIEETREVFTEGGKRVATKTVNLSEPLAKPGYYSTKERLPIPEATPAGKYRIVSRLTYRAGPKAKPALLARTTLDFEVLPKKTR